MLLELPLRAEPKPSEQRDECTAAPLGAARPLALTRGRQRPGTTRCARSARAELPAQPSGRVRAMSDTTPRSFDRLSGQVVSDTTGFRPAQNSPACLPCRRGTEDGARGLRLAARGGGADRGCGGDAAADGREGRARGDRPAGGAGTPDPADAARYRGGRRAARRWLASRVRRPRGRRRCVAAPRRRRAIAPMLTAPRALASSPSSR